MYNIAEVIINLVCESEKFEKKILIHISNSVNDVDLEMQEISNYMRANFHKLDSNSQIIINILWSILDQIQKINLQNDALHNFIDESKGIKNNKKQEYIKNWNNRLFLHRNNDERPITLSTAFIMPNYNIEKCVQSTDKKNNEQLGNFIDRFLQRDIDFTMLISGVPGIGKSSITSWIANEYKNDNRLIILRFRDWDKEDLKNGLLKAIYNTLKCNKYDLNNKILILDGFDEIKLLNNRQKLLDNFFNEMKDFNTKYIITSRPTYINSDNFDNVIRILPFDFEQIRCFYKKITGIELHHICLYNTDVLGIPVILYMAIMSKIDIERNINRAELYSRIFAKKGGIFDRFYYEGMEYDKGAHVLRNSKNINKYLEFLQKTAFRMFEENSLSLLREEYQIPQLEFQGESVSVLEFPIKYLFENVFWGIEFIHKSIYEYFVAEYIGEKIYKVIGIEKLENSAGILGKILRSNNITDEIAEYLSYKILRKNIIIQNISFKEYAKIPSCLEVTNFLQSIFSVMLKNGMTYFCKESYQNIIKCELYIFKNMLKIFQFCFNCNTKLCIEHKNEFITYLSYLSVKDDKVVLAYIDLSEAKFENISMNNITFHEVNLSGTIFDSVNLSQANFKNVDLSRAKFFDVDLSQAILSNANLKRTIFKNSNLKKSKVIESRIDAEVIDVDLQGAEFRESTIEYLDLSNSNLKYVEFINNTIKNDIPMIFDNAIFDLKLIRKAEKMFGDKINNCRVDMCDNILTYKEYIEFREQKIAELQDEILNFLKEGKNYSDI